MAIWYIDNVGGSNANAGTSTILAKQTIDSLVGLTAAGDTVRVKATGSDYILGIPGAATVLFSSVLLTRYTTDTTNPKIFFNGRSATVGFAYHLTPGTVVLNVDLTYDWLTSLTTTCPLHTTGTGVLTYRNCFKKGQRTGGAASNLIFALSNITPNAASRVVLDNCSIEGDGDITIFSVYSATTTAANGTMSGCSIFNMRFGSSGLLRGYGSVLKNEFYNLYYAQANSYLFDLTVGASHGHNTIHILNESGNFTGCAVCTMSANSNTGYSYSFFSNIIYSLKSTTNSIYRPTGATTYGDTMSLANGNNAYFGVDVYNSGITNGREDIGTSIALSGSPFISLVDTDPDFLKLNSSNANGLLCIGASYIDSNLDLGRYQSAGAGASYLNITDVKIGVDRGDGSIGTYDGSDRWTDPGETNVKNLVTYKANSLTNNKTGNRTDASAANVLTGSGTYGANGTEFTPSYSPDFPSVGNVYNDTVNGAAGTLTLPPATRVVNILTDPPLIYGAGGNSHTANFEVPNEQSVVVPYGTYGANGTEFTAAYVLPDQEYYLSTGPLYGGPAAIPGLAVIPPLAEIWEGSFIHYAGIDQTGLLTLPDPAAVLTGEPDFGPSDNLLTPSYSPDFPSAANVLTTDTTNGITGTYLAVTAANVRAGISFGNSSSGVLDLPPEAVVKLGESYDNASKTGTLNSTDPGESNVVNGTNYYINSVLKTGSRSSIYALLNASDVALGIDRGDGITGLYDAVERYTDLDETKVENLLEYRYNSLTNNRTGSLVGGSIDPKYILYPFGTLGTYSENMLDIAAQLNTGIKTTMESILGNEWQELKYFKEIEKNDFYSNTRQYGVRPLGDIPTYEIIGRETINLEFEIKLTTDFINQEGDDAERAAELFLIEKLEAIRRKLRVSLKDFANVRIARDYSRDECEVIESNSVSYCRAVITINYSVN